MAYCSNVSEPADGVEEGEDGMSNQRPFDLAKLDFEGRRLRRRKRLLLYSLPACIFCLLLGAKFLSIPILAGVAQQNYTTMQYDSALGWLGPLRLANWFESFKVSYNSGNALYGKGDYVEAESRFRRALESVPFAHECDVRINLALSIEAQADALLAKKQYDQAIVRYDDVKAVLYDGQDSCGVQFNEVAARDDNGEAGSPSETARDIEKRVQQKSDLAKQARNGDEADADSGESGGSDTTSTQEKLEQLDKLAAEAQKEYSKQSAMSRNLQQYDLNDHSYDTKNW